jgi:hypothetical protein
MKYTVDVKSIMIGFFTATLLFAAFSFKQDTSDETGRYQTSLGQGGMVILDTKTGAYITNTDATNGGWRSGTFSHTHKVVKPTKDKYL